MGLVTVSLEGVEKISVRMLAQHMQALGRARDTILLGCWRAFEAATKEGHKRMERSRIRPIAADNNSWMAHFDPVKLDLAVVLLVTLGTAFVIVRLDAPHWIEFLIVAAVGLGSSGWLALHTRRVVRAAKAQALESMNERRGRDNGP